MQSAHKKISSPAATLLVMPFRHSVRGCHEGRLRRNNCRVKRMLTARVRKLSAESLPLTACGKAALRRRVPASRRRRLRAGCSQDRLPHHSRRQSPITRKCVALGRSTCIPRPGNLCRPRRFPSCLFVAPLGGMAQGGFVATTAQVKRMLAARVQKLSAESLPLTACGEAALRHRLTHAK